MADGNVGNLWVTLGLKDEVTNGIKKLQKEFDGTDEKAKKTQGTLKEIEAALKKPTDKLALNGAIARLITLLEKSKDNVRDLALMLKTLDAKDIDRIFNTKATARNATQYREMIDKIAASLNELHRSPGDEALRLHKSLSDASAYLSIVERLSLAIEALKKSSIVDAGGIWETSLKDQRRDIASIFNTKYWRKHLEEYGADTRSLIDALFKEIAEANKRVSVSSQDVKDSEIAIRKAVEGTTVALKAEEEQAKKTSEAVKGVAEAQNSVKAKPVTPARSMPEVAQEAAYNKELDKMVGKADAALPKIKQEADAANKSLKETGLTLNEVLNAFRGSASKYLGIQEAGEKGRQYVDILNQLNKRYSEILKEQRNPESKDKSKSDLLQRISNALSYLKLLQRIDTAENTLNEKKTANPNIDPNKFKEAERIIANFRKQLTGLESKDFKTGVDVAHVLGNYATTWTMTLKQVDGILGKFQKRNPLSDLDSNFAKVDAKIDSFREKLAKLRDLMNEGTKNGYNTSMLTDRITGMSGIVAQMEKALGNEGKMLSNADQMKQLFSDMQVEMSKTTAALQAYGREKANVIAQEKAHNTAVAESNKSINDAAIAYNKLSSMVKELNKWQEQGLNVLGIGATDNIRQSLSDLAHYQSVLEQIRNNGGRHPTTGQSAKDIIGSADFKKAIDDAKEYAKETKNAIREAEIAKAAAKKKADAATETQRKLDNGEVAYYAKVRDILSQIDALSKGMTPFLNATANKNMAFPSHLVDDLKKLYSVQQILLTNNSAGRNMGLDWLRDFQKRNGFSEIVRELKDFIANADEAKRRYIALFDVLGNLRQQRAISNILGVDTSSIDAQIAKTLTALKELRNIMQTGIGDATGVKNSNARDIVLAKNVIQSQKELNSAQEKTNREKQKSIELEQKHRQEVAQTAAKVRTDLVRAFEQAKEKSGGMSQTMQDLKSLFMQGGIVYGAQQFLMSVIQTGGELEKQHIAMQSILGDMQNASAMFAQTKELALNSPFTFSELNKDVKQLAAYGVEYDQLYDTTKRLADMASGLGVSFERIALAFGQVQARGWLDGKELRQISYAGIPLLNKLSEYYSKREGRKVTTSEVKTRISGRGVDFEDVKDIFWEMTDAGGQFYNMQQELSDTLLGKYNKLKDAWEIMLSEFASGNSIVGSGLKKILELVTWLTQSLHSFAPVIAVAFAGPLLKKMSTSLGGGLDKALLSAKQGLANDYTIKAISGKKLNSVERSILKTKNDITAADIRNLSKANALTQTELKRLYVSGKITQEMYKQGMALTQQDAKSKSIGISGLLRGWTKGDKLKAAGSLIAGGLKSGMSSIVGFLGGLPGIAISAGFAAFAYFAQKRAEMKQAMEQTLNELKDRAQQMDDFLKENNASKAIASGDTKEIDNMIERYEEKIRQISPESAAIFEMSAKEKESHKERLEYLEEQLKMLREANELSQERVKRIEDGNDQNFTSSDFADRHSNALKWTKKMIGEADQNKSFVVEKRNFEMYVAQLKTFYEKEFPKLINNPKQQEAYKAMRDNRLADLGATEKEAKVLRSALDRALGLRDTTMETDLSKKLINMIDNAFPEIANRIRAHKELDEESKKKVQNLMRGATSQLGLEYTYFESELQSLLAASKFEAVIDLVYHESKPMEDIEKLVYDNIMGNVLPNSMQGQAKNTIFEAIKPYLKGVTNMYDARNAVKTALDARYNQMKADEDAFTKGKQTKENVDISRRKYVDLKSAAYEGLGYTYIPEDKKSNKTPKTHEKDKELENLRDRINLYKKLYQEIKKTEDTYGKEGAIPKLKSDGEFKSVFEDEKGFPISNPRKYEDSVKAILNTLPSTTEERKQFKKEQLADIQSENRKVEEDEIKDTNTELDRELSLLAEKYDIYKKLYELTGDRNGAISVAFSGFMMQSDTMLDYLRGEIEKNLPEANERSKSNLTVDDVLGMDESALNRIFGKDSKNISVAVKKLKAEQEKVQQDLINEISEIISKNATLEQQIEDENRSYESKKGKINKSSMSKDMKKRALEGLDKSHNEKSANLKFEKFKRDNDWVAIFDDLDRVSTNTIDSMITKIDDFSKDGTLSVEVVKNLREALSKLKAEAIDRSPFDAIFNATARGNAIGEYLKVAVPNENGKYVLNDKQAKKTGLKAGKEYSKPDLENAQQGAYDDFDKGIGSLSNKFKALQDCMSPVIDLFNALGMEDTPVGEGAGIISSGLGAASQASSGLMSLGLENAGPYGAAAAATLSVLSGIFALHDQALQKDIEASERRQKELENMVKNVKSVIESTLGGLYNYKMDASVKATLRKVQENDKNQYSTATKIAANKAMQNPTNAYQSEKASLLAQRDEIRRQQQDESNKKKKDQDKLDDYKQQLTEIDQQIQQIATDFLNDMYSIDMKSWASELTDAVVDAWSKGEDAMDAYKKKAKELVKDLTKNILSQKIMEAALQKPLDNLTKTIEEKGKLDETDVPKIVDDLYEAGENSVYNITKIMDALKAKGYDFSETGDGSLSNSIKNITEETADILASYVNAIRLDVSVNRKNVKELADFMKAQIPEMGQIQKAQLGQLTQLVVLAENRNDKLDKMISWMSAISTSGQKKVYIN